MNTKTMLFLSTTVLLSACSTINLPSDKGVSVTQSLSFFGPVNDLLPEQRLNKSINNTKPIELGQQSFIPPLTQAVQCNKERTDCKHAVIKTWLEYKVESQTDQSIFVEGVLHSEMGRSFSQNTKSPVYSQEESRTIPESIQLIGESKRDKPFQKKLKLGDELELFGLAGEKVTIKFQ